MRLPPEVGAAANALRRFQRHCDVFREPKEL